MTTPKETARLTRVFLPWLAVVLGCGEPTTPVDRSIDVEATLSAATAVTVEVANQLEQTEITRTLLGVNLGRSFSGGATLADFFGKTFELDTASGFYSPNETRLGAPDRGMRVILYRVGSDGRVELPVNEIGYVDVTSQVGAPDSILFVQAFLQNTLVLEYTGMGVRTPPDPLGIPVPIRFNASGFIGDPSMLSLRALVNGLCWDLEREFELTTQAGVWRRTMRIRGGAGMTCLDTSAEGDFYFGFTSEPSDSTIVELSWSRSACRFGGELSGDLKVTTKSSSGGNGFQVVADTALSIASFRELDGASDPAGSFLLRHAVCSIPTERTVNSITAFLSHGLPHLGAAMTSN